MGVQTTSSLAGAQPQYGQQMMIVPMMSLGPTVFNFNRVRAMRPDGQMQTQFEDAMPAQLMNIVGMRLAVVAM